MKRKGDLAVDLPPNFFPFIQREDADWLPRYEKFNRPGDYHNGGIWPFVCGFYISALVAAKKFKLAEDKLLVLTDLITNSRKTNLAFGFNEWFKAQTGRPMGQDWQTWSASMYLYAAKCVEEEVRRSLTRSDRTAAHLKLDHDATGAEGFSKRSLKPLP